ncbi:hypothetical protein ACTP1G_00690 [Streptococcus milleri]
MSNVAVNVVRIEPDAYDVAVKFANANDLKISKVISMFVRYGVENVELKEVDVRTEKFCIGDQVIN